MRTKRTAARKQITAAEIFALRRKTAADPPASAVQARSPNKRLRQTPVEKVYAQRRAAQQGGAR